ncbi:MAG: hypothetical protein RLY38_433 [Actinomycetota bacterium]
MTKIRKYLGPAFSVLVTVVVLWFVTTWLLKDADLKLVREIISKVSQSSFIFLTLSAVFNVWVFQYPYLVTTRNLKYWQAFQVRNASFAISNSLPAGGTIGLTFQYAMLRSFGIGNKETSATIGIASVWNGLISFFMPVLGLVALVLAGQATQSLIRSTIIGLVILFICLALFYIALKSASGSMWVGNLFSKLVNPIRRIFKKSSLNFSTGINDFRLQVNDLVTTRWRSISISNFMVQIGMFLVLWASVNALELNFSAGIVFAVFCFGRLGTTIPLTPGGLGTTDVIMASLFQLFGASTELSLTAVLLWRGFFYIPQVLLGLMSFIFWQLSRVK